MLATTRTRQKLTKLNVKSRTQAEKEAIEKIQESKQEEYPGLLTRWTSINNAVGKVWRFGQIVNLSGLSGSGKSFIENMIREDFASPELNQHMMDKKPYKILNLSFEMSSADQIIRTLSSYMSVSYNTLLSYYGRISEDFFQEVRKKAYEIDTDMMYYVEDPGNWKQILDTVDDFTMNKFPGHNIVVTLDHTLLAELTDNESENKLITDVMRVARLIKKRYGALVIIVGQLRDDIERPDRTNDAGQHYPRRWDIYGSKKVYMDSDIVMISHRPSRLGINYYGPQEHPTQFDDESDLVAMHVIKGRLTGIEGLMRFKNKFSEGTMEHIPSDQTGNERQQAINLQSNPFE